MKPSLRFSYEDARRQQLRDGIALDTRAKIAFFEEMVALAVRFGARNRHEPVTSPPPPSQTRRR
jgi:hypothetical protein